MGFPVHGFVYWFRYGHGIKPSFCTQAAAISAEGHGLAVRAVNTVLLAVKGLVLCVILNGSDPHRLRRHGCGKMTAVHSVDRSGVGIVRFQRIRLFTPADAAFQNVAQQNASILRLLHCHLAVCAVWVTLSHPVEPLAVLRAHQGGVDKHGFHAQLRRDLRPDSGRHGLVVFVEKKIRLVLVAGDTVV